MRARYLLHVVVVLTAVTTACSKDPNLLKRKYVSDGDKAVAKQNYADALIDYRKAVAVDDGYGEARLKLAAAYEIVGDERNALAQFVRAADLMPDSVPAQIYAAKHLIIARRFPEARARALAALGREPKNVTALILFGNALAGMQDIDGAIVQAQQAIDAAPSVTFSYANLAAFEMQKGNAEAAASAFKRAVEVDPKSPLAHMNLGGFYWVTGKVPQAEQEFKTAVNLNPKAPDANKLMATFYQTTGRRTEGETYLRAYAATGDGPTPKLALADYYLADNRTKEAMEVLRPLAATKEGFGPATLRLAAIDYQANRKPEAYAALDQVLKKYPKNETTNETKARFLLADNRSDEALKVTDAVIASDAQAATSHFLRGLALKQKGDFDAAIKAMQRVLELSPLALAPQSELARLHLAQHDPKAALEFLNVLLRSEPRSGGLHMLLGEALFESRDLLGAERELLPLANANPKSAELQVWAGRVWAAKGDLATARKSFERALTLDPGSLLALDGVVSLDIAEKNAAAAKATLETALTAKGNDPSVLFLAANSFLTLGDAPRAERLFKKVLELDPGHIDAYARLGRLYWSQGRLDEARTTYEAVEKRQATPYMTKTLIGMILELQNRPDEARRQYEQALELNPRAGVAANNLAILKADRGDLESALQLAQTAKSALPDDPMVGDTLGWIYYKKGLTTLAVSTLEQSAGVNPSSPTIQYHLGLAHLKIGNRQEAKRALEQALKLNLAAPDAEDAKRVLASIRG